MPKYKKKYRKLKPGEAASAESMALYRRLVKYALVYWNIFIFAVIGMVIVAAASTAFAALIKPMMDAGFVDRDPEAIKWIPLLLISIFFVRVIGAFASSYGMAVIGRNVIRQLRKEMFHRLLTLPKSFYDQSTTGELISKFSYDVERVAKATTSAITIIIRDSLTVIGLVAWMFYLNVLLTFVILAVAPIMAMIIVYISKRFRKLSRRIQLSMGDVSRIVEESIKAQLVVKIFGGRDYEEEQFSIVNNRNRKQVLKMRRTSALSSPIIQLLIACSLAIVIHMATLDTLDDQITAGTFVSFFIAMSMMMTPVKSLTSILSTLQKGIAAAESVFGFIDLKSELDEGDYKAETVQGLIEFDHVGFGYGTENGTAVDDINITIKAGQTVAFVGRSGSGKTTLLNLLPRLYDISKGDIKLDGVKLQEYNLDNLRSHISYVGQDVVLFNDTISHNIAYGSMKHCSDQEIVEAAKFAYAYDFITESKKGFKTMVGERGVMLSGGQRQRIAIARALLNDAPVLILDEATSALDTESERYIQSSLEKLMQNRTTLIIAHRLSTIENADFIVVMDKGRIVEQGTHQELLELNKHYALLHQMKFDESDAEDDASREEVPIQS